AVRCAVPCVPSAHDEREPAGGRVHVRGGEEHDGEHDQQNEQAPHTAQHGGEEHVRARFPLRDRFRRRRGEALMPARFRRGGAHAGPGSASSTASPYSASFFAPTPLTSPSSETVSGRASTMPTNVASENTMYGGICFSFATEVRQARSASKRSRCAGSRLSAARDAPAARRPLPRAAR